MGSLFQFLVTLLPFGEEIIFPHLLAYRSEEKIICAYINRVLKFTDIESHKNISYVVVSYLKVIKKNVTSKINTIFRNRNVIFHLAFHLHAIPYLNFSWFHSVKFTTTSVD